MPSRWGAGLAAGLLGLAALAGCSKSQPEQSDAIETNAAEELPAAEPSPSPLPAPTVDEPKPAASPDANAAAAEEVAPDAQMLDDADATGMTARVSRDEAPANDSEAQ